MMAVLDPSRFEYIDNSSFLPRCREVMDEEDRVENQDQEGYRSLWGCFNTLFGISFGPAALLSLGPLMVS